MPTRTQSGKARKVTEWGHRVLRWMVRKSSQLSADSKLPLALISAQKLCGGSIMGWVSMAQQPHANLTAQSTMPRVGWSGVKHTVTGLWSSGNMFRLLCLAV